MQRFNGLISLLVVFVSTCRPTDAPNNPTDEDYRVYSAYLLNFEFYRNVPPAEFVILADSTFMPPATIGTIHPQTTWAWVTANLGDRCQREKGSVRCQKAHDPAWAPLFERVKYMAAEKQVALVSARLSAPFPVRSYTWAQQNGSDSEQTNGPGYYYRVSPSKIAYDAARTKALFFSSFVCGERCGRGELIMLEKVSQRWFLVDTFRFWIA